MTKIEVLRGDAEYAFSEFMQSIEGVTEAQAWAALPNLGPDYLHSDGLNPWSGSSRRRRQENKRQCGLSGLRIPLARHLCRRSTN